MKARTWAGITLSLVSSFAMAAEVVLTQTASQTPVAGVSVSCNAGGLHAINRYWRAFDLAPLNLPGPIVIKSVQFGVEVSDANGTGTTQPVTVNVYTSAGAFPNGVLTLRATQQVDVPDQALQLVTVALTTPTAPLPVNSIVVLELFTPSGQGVNNRFFIGANSSGQPGFISAPDCGIQSPAPYANIGFPNVHIILNAIYDRSNSLPENLACARDAINALNPPQIVGPAQKSVLLGLLNVASTNQSGPYRSLSLNAVRSVMARTDGCALRTVPDTLANQGGAGTDFVTTCPSQAPIYACLKDAETQLAAPLPP